MDIQYLKSYRSAQADERRWFDNLKAVNLHIESAGVTNWHAAGVSSGNYGDTLGDKVVKHMEEYERTVERYFDALGSEQEKRTVIHRIIADAFEQPGGNKDFGDIIRYRYLDFRTLKQVARDFEVSHEQMQQWEDEALAILEQYDENEYLEQYRRELEERKNSPEFQEKLQWCMEQHPHNVAQ